MGLICLQFLSAVRAVRGDVVIPSTAPIERSKSDREGIVLSTQVVRKPGSAIMTQELNVAPMNGDG